MTPKGYRGGFKDNKNQIINNNTQFRIFNQIRPRDKEIAPLENMNIDTTLKKAKFNYYQDNKGDVMKIDTEPAYYGKNDLEFNSKKRESRYIFSKRRLHEYLSNHGTNVRHSSSHEGFGTNSKTVLDYGYKDNSFSNMTPQAAFNKEYKSFGEPGLYKRKSLSS